MPFGYVRAEGALVGMLIVLRPELTVVARFDDLKTLSGDCSSQRLNHARSEISSPVITLLFQGCMITL